MIRRALHGTALLVVTAAAALMLLPSVIGLERYVVTGGSMGSAVPRGSIVYERTVPTSDLRVGEVITYRPQNRQERVTHRIVWIHDNAFRTKGDANPAPDPWTFTLPARRQAKAIFHVPYAGYLFAALSVKWVRIALIGLPALAIAMAAIGGELAQRRRDAAIGGEPAT
jgi:signal peptidase I